MFKLIMELLLRFESNLVNIGSVILGFITISFAYKNINLSLFYLFELIIIVTILWYYSHKQKKKFESEVTNIRKLVFIYLGVVSVAILITVLNVNSSEKREKEEQIFEEKNKEDRINYVRQYLFDVDSFGNKISLNNLSEPKNGEEIKRPLIIYYKEDSSHFDFSIEMNKLIDTKYKSFRLDSINTIVILTNQQSYVGTYSNNTTTAVQNETYIYFINRRNLKLIKQVTLQGGLPPSTISYRRRSSAPSTQPGSTISAEEIINRIKSEVYIDNN